MKLQDLSFFTLVTGIANPKTLVDFLNRRGLNFEHLNFKDHHEFSSQDISLLEKKSLILTTEKDFMRLVNYETLHSKLFYLPIKLTLNDTSKFNELIIDYVTTH